MEAVSFGISAALAHLLTNIDNLAIMAGLILSSGRTRVIGCYLLAQAIVLGVALRLGESLGEQLPQYTGYLGVVPVVVGLGALWRRVRLHEEAAHITRRQMGALSILVMFLSVSVDSFAVFAPLMADSEAFYRVAAMIGAVVSAVSLAVVALVVGRMTSGALSRLVRLDAFAPYVMIAVGVYVLMNTVTDVS